MLEFAMPAQPRNTAYPEPQHSAVAEQVWASGAVQQARSCVLPA